MDKVLPTPKDTKKVLFLALSGIGNYLMQAPTIAALKREQPEWEITVWVAPRGSKVLAANDPNVSHVIEAPIRRSLLLNLLHVWKLARRKFDIAIMLSPGQRWKGAAYMLAALISTRLSHRYLHLGNLASSFMLTASVPEIDGQHDIEQNLRLLTLLGIDDAPYQHKPYSLPPLPQTDSDTAARILQKLGHSPEQPIVGIHPGSATGFSWKRWPQEHFITVTRELIDKRSAIILIFGGPAEKELVGDIKSALGKQAVVISESLLTSAAALKQCDVVISNDSGLMHLSAAIGAPTIGLFGPTDEKLTGPRGIHSIALRAPGTEAVYSTDHNYDLGEEAHESLQQLQPNMVLAEVEKILNAKS